MDSAREREKIEVKAEEGEEGRWEERRPKDIQTPHKKEQKIKAGHCGSVRNLQI